MKNEFILFIWYTHVIGVVHKFKGLLTQIVDLTIDLIQIC